MSLAGRPGQFGSRFHNRLYELTGLDFLYKAFTTSDLAGAVTGIRALGIRGCAISMPFKEAVIPLLDGLAPSARSIRSVNTIVNEAGVLTGHNTDYAAVYSLLSCAGLASDTPFFVRGSGGMARAVVAALRALGFTVGTIVARNEARGRALATTYDYGFSSTIPSFPTPLLINATPLGMAGPDADSLAFPEPLIEACEVAFELVAMPAETPFLRAARAAHKPVITGGEVLVLQALEQFVLYTGVVPEPWQVDEAARFARLDDGAARVAQREDRAARSARGD
jgi:shikimate dehydrogenase